MTRGIRAVGMGIALGGLLVLAHEEAIADPDICAKPANRALVLSGGGFKGAFEAGSVYHLVVHRGCDFQDFSGVSVGAINVAFLAQASTKPDSLAALKDYARRLVQVWRGIQTEADVFQKRPLGFVGVFILGWQSLYYTDPLQELIKRNIDVSALKRSGRDVRVGVVSMWDGQYREVTQDTLVENDQQFLDYVLGSASIPIVLYMPKIRENKDAQPDDVNMWAQFADGGVRHNTPVANYFSSTGQIKWAKDNVNHIPRHRSVEELFVVLASPYRHDTDAVEPPPCCTDEKNRQIRNGKKIVERTIDLALNTPYRWDINFATIANAMLTWREEMYRTLQTKLPIDEFLEFSTEMNGIFPVESFNISGGVRWSRPYAMRIVAPERAVGETLETSSKEIAKQLKAGCLTANAALSGKYGFPDLREECEREFGH